MKIKLCKTCKGTGLIETEIGIHQSEYESSICNICNGTGRVKTRTYSYMVPFDTDVREIYKIDSQIIDLIRKLESK